MKPSKRAPGPQRESAQPKRQRPTGGRPEAQRERSGRPGQGQRSAEQRERSNRPGPSSRSPEQRERSNRPGPSSRPAEQRERPNRPGPAQRKSGDRDQQSNFRSKAARPAAERERERERPARPAQAVERQRADRGTALTSAGQGQRQFHIWGRRPIENYLARLQQEEDIDLKSHALYLIADKSGRVPAQLKDIVEPCKNFGFKIILCKSQEDENWPLTSEEQLNHQRVCLRVPRIPTFSIHDIAQSLPDMIAETPHGCLGLVLDQVQDPRNFGAILRTAAFFGAKFVIFGEDRQAEITPLVVKTSSGGAFSLQLVPAVNINRALEILKKSGVWVVGSSLQASARHNELPLDRHYVLVVGNEAKGMRQEVARNCDYLVKIPGGVAAVDSLNVGVATGVLLSTLQSEISRGSMQLSLPSESSDE